MALTLSGTNGVVGAGFTLDASGASVTAGVGTFGSVASSGAVSGTTGTFSGQVSGTIGAFSGTSTFANSINLTHASAGSNIIYFNEDITLSKNGTGSRFAIDSSGNATVNSGNLVIGTSGKGIDFSAAGNVGGMTSELLDDYEEGSWTPVLFGQTGSTNTTSRSPAYGHYTKIGNRVLINFFVEANTGSAGGNIRVAGLPFAPSSTPTHQWCGSFNWYAPGGAQSGSHHSAWVNSKLYLTNGDTNMRLLYHESASNDATLRTADWSAVGTNATYGYFRVAHNFQYFTDA